MNNIEQLLDLINNGTHSKKNKKTKKMEQVPYLVKDFEKCASTWFNRSVLTKNAINGRACCCTCPKCDIITGSAMTAGHYVESCYTNGTFNYDNVDPQCWACNSAKMGKGNKCQHTLKKINQFDWGEGMKGNEKMELWIAELRRTKKKLGELKYIEIFYDSWKAVNHAREEGRTGNIDAWTLSALEKKLINIIENEKN